MHAIFIQLSGLTSLLVFWNRWTEATSPFEETLLMSAGAGIAVYLVLILGDATVQAVLDRRAAAVQDAPSWLKALNDRASSHPID
ncbi:MAG: hypothetical protein AAF730_11365 [Bacteroidota bacterium]